MSRKPNVIILAHQGLGDHLVCNGLYREIAQKHRITLLPVKYVNFWTVRQMLKDQKNIRIFPIPNKQEYILKRIMEVLFRILSYRVIKLGGLDPSFPDKNIRYDENFYNQAKVDFDKRWDSFHFHRKVNSEMELYQSLECDKGKYIFLHDDNKRDFVIKRDLIESSYRIITPLTGKKKVNFFDYALVLQNAVEIHCIESSFCAFVESLQLSQPKFAHRYARPEAMQNFWQEFTYHSNWIIFK
jgi:hypothetical protein